MQAHITYTPPTRPYVSVRAERIPTSGGTWSVWGTFAAGADIPMPLSTGNAFEVRLIAIDSSGLESPSSASVHVSYDDGVAALAAAASATGPDAPTGVAVSYTN